LALFIVNEVAASEFSIMLFLMNSCSVLVAEQIDALQTQVIKQVGCGLHHSVALNDRGQLFTWGDNSSGQLGWQTSENAENNLSRSPKLVVFSYHW